MENLNAVITGVGGYVPDYVLTNDEISKMVGVPMMNGLWGAIGIRKDAFCMRGAWNFIYGS